MPTINNLNGNAENKGSWYSWETALVPLGVPVPQFEKRSFRVTRVDSVSYFNSLYLLSVFVTVNVYELTFVVWFVCVFVACNLYMEQRSTG
jgi:hypothetical protein